MYHSFYNDWCDVHQGEKSTKKASNFFKKNSVLKLLVYIVFCVGPKKKNTGFGSQTLPY